MKNPQTIPIHECGEPLVLIPQDRFLFFTPHPYQSKGAPYGTVSPWMLRKSVLDALLRAADDLAIKHPEWKLKIFDAYRPYLVQRFMVDYALHEAALAEGLNGDTLSDTDRTRLMAKVLRLWSMPSDDPAKPPPHSTGGVVDCTLVDDRGELVYMGSSIDENSDRTNPHYYDNACDVKGKLASENRHILYTLMEKQGFHHHPAEWWHFCIGDQIWASIEEEIKAHPVTAIYGRSDLL